MCESLYEYNHIYMILSICCNIIILCIWFFTFYYKIILNIHKNGKKRIATTHVLTM